MRRTLHIACPPTLVLACVLTWTGTAVRAAEPMDIGSRRELFADGRLIEKLEGTRLQLHQPRPGGTAITFDRPYEGVFVAYVTVLKDGDTYRMYYRGLPTLVGGQAAHAIDTELTCYAESRDGIHWTKPDLGLVEVAGSRDNNVILARSAACHNFSPFIDTRAGVPASERYKAVGGSEKLGLLPFVSADGVRWKPLRAEPLKIKGMFDSQNVVFWSESEQRYVCYFRSWTERGYSGYRWISRATSTDFLTWTEEVPMEFGDAPPEHYYTNQTHPYYRAPHIYVSLFARFMPGRQVVAAEQAKAVGIVGDYFKDCSDAGFMTTRGGNRFDRLFMEGFVRPGPGAGNWTSRTNYPALGIVPTGEAEMSMYVQRNYAQPAHHLERLVLRPDGFVSVQAPYAGGEMLTRPIVFAGRELRINAATSAAGQIQVEIRDAAGEPIAGYTLAESETVVGDELDRRVAWKGGSDVSGLAGKPVRLRFVMKDADLYAMRFQ